METRSVNEPSARTQGFDPARFRYRAFISYSRTDADFADDLYRRLTAFRTPRPLLSRPTAHGTAPRLLRVFLDRKSIEAGGDLSDHLRRRLRESAFLIVVCSVAARQSEWVGREIEEFLAVAGRERILPVLLREHARQPLEDVLPDALVQLGDQCPIGADPLVDGGIVAVRDKLLGGLLGVAQDEIAREQELADRRALRRTRAALVTIASLLVASLVASYVALQSRNAALRSESATSARLSLHHTAELGDSSQGAILALSALPAEVGALAEWRRPFSSQARTALAVSNLWLGGAVVPGDRLLATDFDGRHLAMETPSHLEVREAGSLALRQSWPLWHPEGVLEAAFRTDGAVLAVSTRDGMVRLLDVATGDPICERQTATGGLDRLWLRPGGREVFVGQGAELVAIDASSCVPTSTFVGHERAIQRALFDASGSLLATRAGDRTVRIWDADSGEMLSVVESRATMGFRDLALAPDGSALVTSRSAEESGGVTFERWDPETGRLTHSETVPSSGSLGPIAVSPSSQFVATGEGEAIAVRRAEDLSVIRRLQGHSGPVTELRFGPDGVALASNGRDGALRVWDSATGRSHGHHLRIRNNDWGLHFVDGGRALLVASAPATTYPVPPGLPLQHLVGHEGPLESVAFSPDVTRLATASRDGTVRLWDVESGAVQGQIPVARPGLGLEGVAFSTDGEQLLVWGLDSGVGVWRAEDLELVWRVFSDEGTNEAIFSPDGTLVAMGDAGGAVALVRAATGESGAPLEGHDGAVRGIVFSPDGARLLTHGADDHYRIWDTATGARQVDVRHVGGHPRFTPDGDAFVVPDPSTGWIFVFDATTGETLARLRPSSDQDSIEVIALTRDGRVISGGRGATVAVTDWRSGRELLRVGSDQRNLSGIAVSPDERYFVTSAYGGPPAVLWDLETGRRLVTYSMGVGLEEARGVAFARAVPGRPMRFATGGRRGAAIWAAPRPGDDPGLRADTCAALRLRSAGMSDDLASRSAALCGGS